MNPLKWLLELRSVKVTGEDWAAGLVLFIFCGILLITYYGVTSGSYVHLTSALFLAGSFLLMGIFIGFLFGIPRLLQLPPPSDAPDSAGSAKGNEIGNNIRYLANTNLEQISDWLTKILVGVGLTQLTALPDQLDRLGGYFGPSLGASASASRIAIVIVIFYSVSGFLFGYIWTRLFLARQLAKADLEAVESQVRQVVEAQEKQGIIDAAAISLVTQYLTSNEIPKIPVDKLKSAVRDASPPVKVQLFYQARSTRAQSWQNVDTRWRIDRTIPVFEALVEADTEKRFHQNHAQLGFALKDRRSPNYARAEAELSTAIDIRGPASDVGWSIYEFNRAICRIQQDLQFRSGTASSPEIRTQVIADLRVAVVDMPDFGNDAVVLKWLRLNNVNIVLPASEHQHGDTSESWDVTKVQSSAMEEEKK